jgi:spore germination cell wall hydrolase CwlJ-like protein
LAKVISAEARGESYEGQVAVGAVILNRVKHPSFPDSISGVVYQKGAFSCVNDSNWYAAVADSSKRAAIDALNGWDPSGGQFIISTLPKHQMLLCIQGRLLKQSAIINSAFSFIL